MYYLHSRRTWYEGPQDSTTPPLAFVARFGYSQTFSLLLEQNANLNLKYELDSALTAASLNVRERAVRLLLDAGADPWRRYNNYSCALQAALTSVSEGEEREGCIRAILDAPGAIDCCRKIGYWPLIHASFHQTARIVALLIRYGAQVNDRTWIPVLLDV